MTDRTISFYKSSVAHPEFGKEPITIYFMSKDEALLQFNEIFTGRFYKEGRMKKDMVVVDIGAAYGFSALYFKDYAKVIYALEPNEDLFECMKRNTKKYKNIKCFPFGIAGNSRKSTLYGYNGAEASTTEKRDNPTSQEEILLLSLEEFMKQQNIDHIDLLKVDCEGSEYEIFISDAFKRVAGKIDSIIGEAHWQAPYYPMFIPEMLKENGFSVKWLEPFNWIQRLNLQLTDGQIKEYQVPLQTLFFAQR